MLEAKVSLVDGMQFEAITGSGHKVIMDSGAAGGGQDKGPRPMELPLVALGGCSAFDVISMLRKSRQNVTGYDIVVKGERRSEDPKVFVEITVEHIVKGKDISPAAVERAVKLSEEKYCSVSAMLSKTAKVTFTYSVIEE